MSDNSDGATCELVIVGAGVGGIGAAIGLKHRGFTDFVILEQNDDVGGTWLDHLYPGLTVDIPSLTYSFSFEQKPDWSSLWAPQAEVLDYCRHCAERYGLRPHLRFGRTVRSATYDRPRNVWTVEVEDGTSYTCRYLINASGFLNTPRWPDIDGFDTFEGRRLHTSQWTSDVDVRGQRVAVIGTGATAIQLAPEIAPVVQRLTLYQRTPIWLLPKPPMRLSPRLQQAFAGVPGLQRAARLTTSVSMEMVFWRVFTHYRHVAPLGRLAEKACLANMAVVRDPVTRERLTPRYNWGCKRPSFSNAFYPMFNRENVELVVEPIERITSRGIATRDGVERELDTLICATGYRPFEKGTLPTYPVRTTDGTDLWDHWDSSRNHAFRGFAVHGFPNFFLVFGPYAISGTSYFTMVETITRAITNCLRDAQARNADYIEVKQEAQAQDLRQILSRKRHSIWRTGNCGLSNTVYIDRFGDTPQFRPSYQPVQWLESRLPSAQYFDFKRVGSELERLPSLNTVAAA